MSTLELVFGWLLSASWQASVLALFVLLAQTLLGKWLNPRWRYALWLLVLLRLVVPALPESTLSLFQFTPPPPAALTGSIAEPLFTTQPIAMPSGIPVEISEPRHHPVSLYSLLAVIWLVGAMTLFVLTWIVNRRFARQVSASPEIADPALVKSFTDARAEIAIRRPIRLVESPQVSSPAIMGLFQPTLLLPTDVRGKFDATDLRLIFLHELAHLKRGDVIVQALIALLQILHWFNPVLWYAFRRMRIDREPATDALVLSHTGEAEKERYGLMLIKLLEHFNQRHSLPTLVGILEDKDQFKRRFSLIARFTRGAYGWSLLGGVLIAILAVAFLTKAVSSSAVDRSKGMTRVNDSPRLFPATSPSNDPGEMLTVRTFLVPPNFLAGTSSANAPAAVNANLISDLMNKGIQSPPGATVTFLPDSNKLVARNTPKQLDLIAAQIEKANYSRPNAESPQQRYLEIFLADDKYRNIWPKPDEWTRLKDALFQLEKFKADFPTFETQLIDRRMEDAKKRIAVLEGEAAPKANETVAPPSRLNIGNTVDPSLDKVRIQFYAVSLDENYYQSHRPEISDAVLKGSYLFLENLPTAEQITKVATGTTFGDGAGVFSGPNRPCLLFWCIVFKVEGKISVDGQITMNSPVWTQNPKKLTLVPIPRAAFPFVGLLNPTEAQAFPPEGILEPAAALIPSEKKPRRLFVFVSVWPEPNPATTQPAPILDRAPKNML